MPFALLRPFAPGSTQFRNPTYANTQQIIHKLMQLLQHNFSQNTLGMYPLSPRGVGRIFSPVSADGIL